MMRRFTPTPAERASPAVKERINGLLDDLEGMVMGDRRRVLELEQRLAETPTVDQAVAVLECAGWSLIPPLDPPA